MHPKNRNHHNRLVDHITAYLKTRQVLLKTCHVAENQEISYFFDFWPFLPYSMNKKRRWELEINVDLLEILTEINENQVLLIERIRKGPYDYPRHYETSLPEQFSIKSINRLTENNRYFEKIHPKSPQPIEQFPQKIDKKSIITYQFLKNPPNYRFLFEKQCISRKTNDWPYTTGWQRIERLKNLKKFLKFENFTEMEMEEFHEENGGNSEKIDKFYNLEDHVVIKKR